MTDRRPRSRASAALTALAVTLLMAASAHAQTCDHTSRTASVATSRHDDRRMAKPTMSMMSITSAMSAMSTMPSALESDVQVGVVPPMHHAMRAHVGGARPDVRSASPSTPSVRAQLSARGTDCCANPEGNAPGCPSCPVGMGCANSVPPSALASVTLASAARVTGGVAHGGSSISPATWSRALDTPPPRG